MEEFFKDLEEKEQGTLILKESKWWNGNMYSPIYLYELKYKYKESEIIFNYENRLSEFTKPSMIDGGALGDRHICEVLCKVKSKKGFSDFEITERGFFSKIIKKNKGNLFKVKCENLQVKEFLLENKSLYYLFAIVENSPEFSPEIIGVKESELDNEYLVLKIRYNTQQENRSILFLINDFCKEISVYLGS